MPALAGGRDDRLPRTRLAHYIGPLALISLHLGHAVSCRPSRPRQTLADHGDDRARHRIEGGRARYHQPRSASPISIRRQISRRRRSRRCGAARPATPCSTADRAEAGGLRQVQARERARLRASQITSQLRRQAGALQCDGRHDQPRGRGRDPGAVLGVLPGDGAAVRRHSGAGAVPAKQWLQDAARGSRRGDHAADQMADPELAVEPERGRLHRGGSAGFCRGAAAPPACLGHDRRHVRAPRLRRFRIHDDRRRSSRVSTSGP